MLHASCSTSTRTGLVPLPGGDALLLFSSNSIAFPVVLLGTVAASIKCSSTNSAYVTRKLQHQYTDRGASVVVTSRAGLPIVLDMFRALAIPEEEIGRGIVVIGASLAWAAGPAIDDLPLDELLMGALLGSLNRVVNGASAVSVPVPVTSEVTRPSFNGCWQQHQVRRCHLDHCQP
ncbi:putative acetyl-CoA synthetase-like protein [Lyophyllum shimeji]|uniref:Acetyl-CoA synthetase-like protein n=1 Tax=Lyophyllum shimeji TaxID=47721 RepID=A0A9P3PYZ7_LYOSH|nr:putative acetyl-CoA synthetase-like protein [Lyophyllum shimeji]